MISTDLISYSVLILVLLRSFVGCKAFFVGPINVFDTVL